LPPTKVIEIMEKAMVAAVSKSYVSRTCGEIDKRMKLCLERPLEGDWLSGLLDRSK
jgi:transposase-like protein